MRLFATARVVVTTRVVGQRDLEWMIEQLLDGFYEADRVRQLGVTFERRHVPPAGVNVELVRIAQRMKASVLRQPGSSRVGVCTSYMARCTSPCFPGRA